MQVIVRDSKSPSGAKVKMGASKQLATEFCQIFDAETRVNAFLLGQRNAHRVLLALSRTMTGADENYLHVSGCWFLVDVIY